MFGRRSRVRRAVDAAGESVESVARGAQSAVQSDRKKVGSLWTDGLGFLATRSLQIIIVVGLTAAVIWGMHTLTTVIIPILLALILASTFAPVMGWLRKHRMPSALATVIVLLSILLLLTGVGWLIVWAVRDQWDDLSAQAHDGFLQVIEWAQTLPFAPEAEQFHEWRENVVSFGTDYLTSARFGSGALAGVSVITNFVTGLVLLFVVLFFFLKDGPKLWRFMLRPFEGANLARAERAGQKTVDTLGSYVRGTASVAAVDAVGIWIGLVILNVPLAIPLGVLVFFLAFIPIVGATSAGILAALVALVSNGPLNAVLVIGVVVLVNQLEGNLLQPVLMGRALKLHPLVILLVLAIGILVAGIIGGVLAVPIAAVVWGIIKVWDGPNTPVRWARPAPDEVEA